MIIEIIGVSGAGKSTLYKNLVNARTLNKPGTQKINFINDFFLFFPAVTKVFLNIQLLRFSKQKMLIKNLYLFFHISVTIKKIEHNKHHRDFLFDQGIIYQLASLIYFGFPESMQDKARLKFSNVIKSYIKHLDNLIFLNIKTDTALKRVISRKSYHMIKDFDEHKRAAFMNFYKHYYSYICCIAKENQIKVIELDSTFITPSKLSEKVIGKI